VDRIKQLGGTLPLLGELQPLARQLFVALLALFVPATVREPPAFRRVCAESLRLAVQRLNTARPIAGGEEIYCHGDLHHLVPFAWKISALVSFAL